MRALPPVPRPRPAPLTALREACERAGLHEEILDQVTRDRVPRSAWPSKISLSGGDGRLATMLRLFPCEEEVSAAAATAAFGAQGMRELTAGGLLEASSTGVRSWFRMDPFGDLFIVADRPSRVHPDAAVVPGVTPVGRMLEALTVRMPAAVTLDLGTGSGLQALRAACAAVAVNVNPRALELAGLNIALNDVTSIELVLGSWLEPVRGQRFDHIVANLQFVLAPEPSFLFSDGSLAQTLDLLRELPSALALGGVAQILQSGLMRAAWLRRRS